jgi:prepilin-type N-terminal cleavage/methylation domain-containing protein
MNNLSKKQKGFTIIEVLIVLAIAGLIMVIVFLAVPALQRNSRNTQRTSDAARTAAAVNECLANNNGTTANCNNLTAAQLSNYITIANNQQLTAAGAAGLNSMQLVFGSSCNAAGTAGGGPGGARAYHVLFQVETTNTPTPRCVSG